MKYDCDRQTVIEAINHYSRMINHVSHYYNIKQRLTNYNSPRSIKSLQLRKDLGENYTSAFCSLCLSVKDKSCIACPLANWYMACDNLKDGNIWQMMSGAQTWGEWLKYAKQLRQRIRNILSE